MRLRMSFALAGLMILSLAIACFAATEERVAPPEDAAAFHLSIVGSTSDPWYNALLDWFQSDENLASLRRTVHWHAVTTGTPMYNERYAPNTPSLPMVRLQDGKGGVLYQACGSELPRTPEALASAIERKTSQIFNRPLLPWRRKIEQKCGPGGCPTPKQELTPEDLMLDESPLPPSPVLSEPPAEPQSQGVPVLVCVACAVLSLVGGFGGAILGSIRREMQG